jgi:hypothetical protein
MKMIYGHNEKQDAKLKLVSGIETLQVLLPKDRLYNFKRLTFINSM